MEKSVKIPEGVEVSFDGLKLKVKGKLGEVERDFYNRGTANLIKIEKVGEEIKVTSKKDSKKEKSLVGTTIAHINNLFKGVTSGYKYELKVVYVHFPLSVKKNNDEIVVSNFLGQKGDKKMKIPENVKVEIKKQDITVSGIEKELVGQTAANLEKLTKVCKKDRRRFQDGIFIIEKAMPSE